MKKVRLITSAALVAIAGLTMTMTSCNPEPVECAVGYEGKNCKDEVRESYYNTYIGDGINDHGGTYTDWSITFEKGTALEDVTSMKLYVKDANETNQHIFDVNLTTNTTYSIVPVFKDGWEFTGNGTVSVNSASLTFTEVDPDGIEETYTYTFSNMIAE